MKKIVSFLVLISLSSLSLVQSLYGAGGGEEGGDGYQRLPQDHQNEARRVIRRGNRWNTSGHLALPVNQDQ